MKRNGRCSFLPSPPCWPKPVQSFGSSESRTMWLWPGTPCRLARSSATRRCEIRPYEGSPDPVFSFEGTASPPRRGRLPDRQNKAMRPSRCEQQQYPRRPARTSLSSFCSECIFSLTDKSWHLLRYLLGIVAAKCVKENTRRKLLTQPYL